MEYGVQGAPAARGKDPRRIAGQALILFFLLMALLSLCSRTLQEMSVATVQSTRPQRGALERRVQGDGTLAAGAEVPLIVPHAARVLDVLTRAGAAVEEGDALLVLDYAALLREKYEALAKAQQEAAGKKQAYDWAAADVSASALDRMESREAALVLAAEALVTAQQAYEDALEAQSDTQSRLDDAQAAFDALDSSQNQKALDDAKEAQRLAGRQVKSTGDALTRAEKDEEDARDKVDGYSRVRDYLTKQGEWETAALAEANALSAYLELIGVLDEPPDGEDIPPYVQGQEYIRTVRAPRTGTVGTLNAKSGALLATDTPALTLNPSGGSLSLEVPVDAAQIGDIQVGDPADIVIDGRIHESQVTAIAPSAKDEGKYNVRFDLPEGVGSAGMRATMHFRKRTQSYDLLIPLSALRSDTQGDYVYLIDQRDSSLGTRSTLTRVSVTVLEKDTTRAAVSGGFSQGDLLATRGDRTLSDGDRVRLSGE